jgi:hypothetical protein
LNRTAHKKEFFWFAQNPEGRPRPIDRNNAEKSRRVGNEPGKKFRPNRWSAESRYFEDFRYRRWVKSYFYIYISAGGKVVKAKSWILEKTKACQMGDGGLTQSRWVAI